MAINKNHEFEELDGVKCGIVERNVSIERVAFLRKLLEFNHYAVVAIPSPAAKSVNAAVEKTVENEPVTETQVSAGNAPETFTVGVTDYTFNPVNAIFGRLLKTPDGHIVTLAYWQQKDTISHDSKPYYE